MPPRPMPAVSVVSAHSKTRQTKLPLQPSPFATPKSLRDRELPPIPAQNVQSELPLSSLHLAENRVEKNSISSGDKVMSERSKEELASTAEYKPQADSSFAPAPASTAIVKEPNEEEKITYQYALRYAMILDAENAQLAARAHGIGMPGVSEGGRTIGRANSGNNSGFSVKSVGKASGTSNLNNRTPTLVAPNKASVVADTSNTAEQQSRLKGKKWKTSLLELGDSTARKIKAEMSNSSKLKSLAKGITGGGKEPSVNHTRDGGLTHSIVKAVAQQLKSAASVSSLHPLTRECYLEIHEYLRAKEHSEALGAHGTINDLLDVFSEQAQAVCARHGITSEPDATNTVDSQLSRFVKLLRSVLQAKAHTSREAGLALIKLDDVPETQLSGTRVRAESDASLSGNCYGHSSSASGGEDKSSGQISAWLRKAFQVPEDGHNQIVAELKKEVNQETATQDLRMCLLVLKKNMSFAGKPEHFRTPHAYNLWKDREITSLEQLIHTYSIRQSFMSGEHISAGRLKLEASAIEALGDEEIASAFEYIPTNAAQHYRRLTQLAVLHDIVSALGLSDSASGSTDSNSNIASAIQLSNSAKELLKQLAIAWRISAPYRETCYLDVINEYYEQGALSATYLLDAFNKTERIVHLMNPLDWHLSQYEYLLEVEGRIEYNALGRARDVIEELDQQRPEKNIYLRRILRSLVINDVTCPVVPNKPMPNIEGRRQEVMSVIEPSIVYRYECLAGQCFGDDTISSRIDGYAQLAALIMRDCERCHSIFFDPLLEDGDRRFDIAGMMAEIETTHLYTDLLRHVQQFGYTTRSIDVEATFELCNLITKIERLHEQSSGKPLEGIDNKRLFKESVETWMRNIDQEKAKWVENALKHDSYPRELDIGKHSTSVIDLVSCFAQQASIAQKLKWPDVDTKVYFLTQFMKYVDITFEVYAAMMLKQFMSCLSLPVEENKDSKSTGWNSMWNSRKYKEQLLSLSSTTQAALAQLDQSSPVEISVEACVRLNNLTIAKERLFELHKELDIRETIEEAGGVNRESINKVKPESYLLSFKIIRAEGLEMFKKQYDTNIDAGARPYVKLATTRQADKDVTKRATFAKTRPALSGPINPRWNESFDLQLGSGDELVAPLEARICTRDGPKALGHREKTRARAFFAPPAGTALAADGSVDMVLDLEPSGHLLLQVTMDGELDDVEFYSGRIFRFLDRTLSDMQQRIVEQVSVGVREYLRQILVAQPTRYRRASRIPGQRNVGIERGIERSIQFLKSGGHQEPATIRITQESCCEALIPLVDYLEDNLHTVFVNLYEDTANGVLVKVWNEILVSLEDILLPPLRGLSKGSAKPLTESDLHNIFDCLDFLKWYFEGGSDKDGIPSDVLENRKYNVLLAVREMYFMTSRELIDAYISELRESANDKDSFSAGAKHLDNRQLLSPASFRSGDLHIQSESSAGISSVTKRPLPLPPTPPRPGSKDGQIPRRFSNCDDGGFNSSSDTLPMTSQEIRTAIVPSPANKASLSRSRSVWAHKDAETLNRFKRSHRMVTDKGDLILRLLRLRFDKEASKFVQTQLEVRAQQMHYEMRRAVKLSNK
ncbi:hypothetical protein GGI26_002451 [Coemansia sp. RSA 1358]|nr:hypothetical protein GGI26_002451 [Coemansia sp. RSA 1358]